MKKNRIFDKNQIVVACLLFICVLLIFIIFFISHRTISTVGSAQVPVTRAEVAEAYAFLGQDEAVQTALHGLQTDEMVTYGDYREFLEQLHLWEAIDFEQFLDWEQCENQRVSADMLAESRNTVAELFETSAPAPEKQAQTSTADLVLSMPQVDEHTKIRVLLLRAGEPVAKEVRFSANEAYTISWNGKTKKKKKNQVIRAGQLKLNVGQTAVVQSAKGEVYLADEDGSRATLGYSGSIHITRYAGGYAVVNEVAIEDYLYGVVQSEMPAYFATEALKAQAVCARTYIVAQLMQDNYPQYDADVDDSVQFQAYNKAAPDARVVEAVDATRGQILSKDGLPIHAYFFSTSYGMTSGREIWGLSSLDYLQPVRGNQEADTQDLSDEKNFRAYIKEQNSDDYDASSSYYRWKAQLDLSNHLADVKTFLKGIDETQTEHVIIRDSSGKETTKAAMEAWEEALQLKVLERSSSGAVKRLLIVFSGGEAELLNESCIRQLLGIWMTGLQDKDGSSLSVGDMLPSAYFYVQPVEDGIVLFGGGLGHGIGMSQYGADGMAKRGADMKEILDFYYRDVSLEQLYGEDLT